MKTTRHRVLFPIGVLIVATAICFTSCRNPRQETTTANPASSIKQTAIHMSICMTSDTPPAVAENFKVYDTNFITAVQTRWYATLDSVSFSKYKTGEVRLSFKLNSSGEISDLKTVENTTADFQLNACRKAILAPAPYEKWPEGMRQLVGKDFREIAFTFEYRPFH